MHIDFINIPKLATEIRYKLNKKKIAGMPVSIEKIIAILKYHGVKKDKLAEVQKAYDIACEIHKNQRRQSGEPYIIHPLNVAYNVLRMEVYDADTVSAALLHDTVEDAEDECFTKQDIINQINSVVAELVDGVTKLRGMTLSTEEKENGNTRKIINGLTKDIRIIIIKLADRIHNMSTIEFKTPEKQRENAFETIELFVPLAITIGAYQVKNELEELSFKYLEPEVYQEITKRREEIRQKEQKQLETMADKIQKKLKKKHIKNKIVFRQQSMYTIYKKIKKGYKIDNMYDLCYFKIIVDDEDDCYKTLGIVHSLYHPINGRLKDYIYNPKTSFYQSLHTTVTDENEKFRKVKIRTKDMDKLAAYGLTAYLNIKNGKNIDEINEIIRGQCQFAKKLIELDESFKDNSEFIGQIKRVLLTEHVYVYGEKGEAIELPEGSTAIDFVCQVAPDKLDAITGVVVNGKEVNMNQQLQNNDRIQILTYGKVNHENWEAYATTDSAKQKIKSMEEKKDNIE